MNRSKTRQFGRPFLFLVVALATVLLAACQTPEREHQPRYPDQGHPQSPDPAPQW